MGRISSVAVAGAGLCLAVALLTGCAAKRDAYVTPAVPVPNQFRQSAPAVAEAPAAPLEPADEALESNVRFVDEMLAEWWRVLGSKELDALMDQAIANNADLRVATLRIVQSKARAEQARADELPSVTAPYEARIEAPAGGVGSIAAGQEVNSRRVYQGGLRADMRADVWGERRALAESAQLQLWRAVYQRDDARRTLLATVAAQYIEYLSLNDRVRVARETETVLRGMLESVAGRLKAGDATITDLEQQRAAVYAVQATIPALELQRENAINALAQLLGATPGSLALSQRGMDSLSFPRVLPGVPANLLLRRPDVRAVEARLLAADADIDVARTRLLPSIDLTTQVGFGSLMFSRLLQPQSLAWNAIGSLSASIFDAGKRNNEVVFARALHEELVETYVRTLYFAIRETEDAIAAVQMNGKRLQAQGAATRAAKRAWDYSMEAYREGAIDYLTLLDTERTYHRNLDEYHRVSMERHKGLVGMFSSLGGGIPRNAPAPARGEPPADALGDYATQAAARAPIQFNPRDIEGPGARPFWLVELAGLQDRVGVTHVWRDLAHRFPDLMAERIVLPRIQGRVADAREERTAWYRTFIARFPTQESAKAFCDRLAAALIRCQPLRSDAPAFQDVADVPPVQSAALSDPGPAPAPEKRPAARPQRGPALKAPPLQTSPGDDARVEVSPTPVEVAPRVPEAPAGGLMQARLTTVEPSAVVPRLPVPPQAAVPAPLSAHAVAPAAEPGAQAAKLGYSVQLATMSTEAGAVATERSWSKRGYKTFVYPVANATGAIRYTVRTGLFESQSEAGAQAAAIRRTEQVFAVPVRIALDESGQPAPSVLPGPR